MPAQVLSSVENNFTKGLVTEFTGMNFPENAATDTDNSVYTIVGDVIRREGINYETNFTLNTIDRTTKALSDYKWNNVGGDGTTQIVVTQVGSTLYFYRNSTATIASPLSSQKLASTVDLTTFGTVDATAECTYADGNGYLFVYHPSIDPIYCTYNAGTITAASITVNIRDFTGVLDSLPIDSRITTLSNDHLYNLQNQGWTKANPWVATSATISPNSHTTGNHTFTVAAAIAGLTVGDNVTITSSIASSPPTVFPNIASGVVFSYAGTTLVINITGLGTTSFIGMSSWTITPTNRGYITTWQSALGNYPSNCDVWWYFKNTSNVFDPTTTKDNVTLGGRAPRGHYVMPAFSQTRSAISATSGINDVTTTARPTNGCWYQGRVWYTGVNAQQAPTTDTDQYTWTESIYFSQIAVAPADFGNCYQTNDPTSQTLFGLLPSDGGTIQIQGSGAIYKLWPLVNALIVFAANGIWYITGSQGVGFAANDYTVVKLSGVRSSSSTSYVDVNGYPYFWNEDSIYSVKPAKQGQSLLSSPLHVMPLEVESITVGTILTYYGNIPLQSKKYARGDYNPIDYTIQWCFRSTNETSVTDRYQFDKILNLNVHNSAFYPYSMTGTPWVHGVRYVAGAGGSTSPAPVFKYLSSQLVTGTYKFTFAEENDSSYLDWKSFDSIGTNYVSYFVTGYKLHGGAQRRFQIPYIYVYSKLATAVGYKIQSQWDYSSSGTSGRWSVSQLVNIPASASYGNTFKRHRLRGQGLIMQIRVTSVDGVPFDIMGWSIFEVMNQGV